MHMNIYQLPTTLLMGLLLGVLVVRSRSLWPAVCLHALHNGLSLALQLHVGEAILTDVRWAWVLAGPVCSIVLLWRLGAQPATRKERV